MGTEIFVIQRCQLLKEKEKAFLMKEFTLKKQLIIIKSMFYYCYIILCVIMQVYIDIFFNYWGFIIFVGTNFQQKTKSLKICIIITQIHVIILRKPKYINFLKKTSFHSSSKNLKTLMWHNENRFLVYWSFEQVILLYLEFAMGLPVLDPVLALALGVNQQGVSGGLGHNDTILCGQLVIRQAL